MEINITKLYNIIHKLSVDILGREITDNIEINDLVKKVIGSQFLGVYAKDDKLPKITNNTGLIINTTERHTGGEHWMVLINFNNQLYLYDSFDRSINELKFEKFKNIINLSDIDHPKDPAEQSIHQMDCGPRSIAFLITVLGYNIDPVELKKNI